MPSTRIRREAAKSAPVLSISQNGSTGGQEDERRNDVEDGRAPHSFFHHAADGKAPAPKVLKVVLAAAALFVFGACNLCWARTMLDLPTPAAASIASAESQGGGRPTVALADIKAKVDENANSIVEVKGLLQQYGNGSSGEEISSLLGSIHERQLVLVERLDELVPSNATEAVHPRDAHPVVLYGHIHMAKTGGTALNGILANKFERVCGHKGYSYDAYSDNERAKISAKKNVWVKAKGRSKVDGAVMEETGYEDCDYVSHETNNYTFWESKFGGKRFHGVEMELHLPCRRPIDHLMSQCNHKHKPLHCDAETDEDFYRQIDECALKRWRFSKELLKHFTVKCFNFAAQFTTYIDHMAGILQHRRFESAPYVKRETNRARNKKNECIWSDEKAYAKAEAYLKETYDYYKFCDECLGSKNDITRNT
ncbi:hypothetical protein ACHAXT_000685 [Thalassiosira profunda]